MRIRLQGDHETVLRAAECLPGVLCAFRLRPDGLMCMPGLSPAASAVFGVDADVAAEDFAPALERVHPADREAFVASIYRSAESLAAWHQEWRVLLPDGSVRNIEGMSQPVREADGGTIWHGYVADVTAVHQEKRRLQEQRDRTEKMLDVSSAMIVALDPQGRVTMVNKKFCDVLGYERHEIIGQDWFDRCIPPERVRASRTAFDRVISGEMEPIANYEYVVLTKSGERRLIHWQNAYIDHADDRIDALIGSGEDVTERREMEDAFGASERLLKAAGQVACVGGWEYDLQRGKLSWTEQTRIIHEVPPDFEPDLESAIDFYAPEARAQIREAVARCEVDATPWDLELPLITAKGQRLWVRAQGAADQVDGRTVRMYGAFQEITRRKTMELELREKTRELDNFFELSQDLLCIASTEGSILKLNPIWEGHLGYKINDLIGRQFLDFVHPDDQEPTLDAVQNLVDGKNLTSFINRYRARDGSYRYLDWSSYQQDGIIYATARDITEKLKSESEHLKFMERVQQTQKLESLGVMAGGIAHDFNNLLTVILGRVDMALRATPTGSRERAHLANALDAANMARDLTGQLLAYSGHSPLTMQRLDISTELQAVKELLAASISKKCDLQMNLAESLPPILGDSAQIRQVIMNLLINASESLDDAPGIVRLSTGVERCGEMTRQSDVLGGTLPAGEYIYLEVADSGCGMSSETMSKVFDPFFTTKFTGRGLGLAAVQGIIRAHSGRITVDSSPAGSTFRIYFPLQIVTLPQTTQATGADPVLAALGTVLIVDDEAGVRELAEAMLTDLGYQVRHAINGQQAIEIYDEEPELYTLVLLDHTMPELNGRQVLDRLRLRSPTLPVILSSGYKEHTVTADKADAMRVAFLQKPYMFAELQAAVRLACDGAKATP